MGVVDDLPRKGWNRKPDQAKRRDFLRKIGYKL